MHRDAHMDETWAPSRASHLSRVAPSDDERRSSRIRAASHAPSDNAPFANSSQKRVSPSNKEPPRKRPQRKRTTRPTAEVEDELSTEDGMKPLTLEERMNWEGWVDLESDPALFNYILREYGVKGVKIQEVFSLDDEMLAVLPQPVYGLIFLFKYRATDDHDDEEGGMLAPGDIWFANQTINNACATVAMLNIVMNAPDIDLGYTLAEFKAKTQELEPAYRGKTLGENEFIRNIHNSFARKVDIYNVDLSDNDFAKWQKTMVKLTNKKKPGANNRKKKKKKPCVEEFPFHFVAYVPINAQVWRFDGLQHQPLNLGESNGNWISVARQHIEKRMAQYEEDGVEFNLLSLCRSPLLSIPTRMAMAIKAIKRVEGQLDYVKLDWREFTLNEASIGQPDGSYGLTKEIMDNARLPDATIENIENAEGNLIDLINLHRQLSQDLAQLRGSYIEEVAAISKENEQAAIRMVSDPNLIHGARTSPETDRQETVMVETKDKLSPTSSFVRVQKAHKKGEPHADADGKAIQETTQSPPSEAYTKALGNGADPDNPSKELQPFENINATTYINTVLSKEIQAEGGTTTPAVEVEKVQTGESFTNVSIIGVDIAQKENENTMNGGAGNIPKNFKRMSHGACASFQANDILKDTVDLHEVKGTT